MAVLSVSKHVFHSQHVTKPYKFNSQFNYAFLMFPTGVALVVDAIRTHDNHYPGFAHKIVLLNSELFIAYIIAVY
jgi:hypothetical protein